MVKSGIGLAGRGVPGAGHLSLSVAVAFDSRTGHFFSQVAFASAAETPHASQVLRLASAVLHFESHCAVARVVSMDVNPRVMTMIPAIVQKAPVIVPTPMSAALFRSPIFSRTLSSQSAQLPAIAMGPIGQFASWPRRTVAPSIQMACGSSIRKLA